MQGERDQQRFAVAWNHVVEEAYPHFSHQFQEVQNSNRLVIIQTFVKIIHVIIHFENDYNLGLMQVENVVTSEPQFNKLIFSDGRCPRYAGRFASFQIRFGSQYSKFLNSKRLHPSARVPD